MSEVRGGEKKTNWKKELCVVYVKVSGGRMRQGACGGFFFTGTQARERLGGARASSVIPERTRSPPAQA